MFEKQRPGETPGMYQKRVQREGSIAAAIVTAVIGISLVSLVAIAGQSAEEPDAGVLPLQEQPRAAIVIGETYSDVTVYRPGKPVLYQVHPAKTPEQRGKIAWAAIANAEPGTVVRLGPGIFRFDKAIPVGDDNSKDWITVEGSGWGTVCESTYAKPASAGQWEAYGNVVLRNLRLRDINPDPDGTQCSGVVGFAVKDNQNRESYTPPHKRPAHLRLENVWVDAIMWGVYSWSETFAAEPYGHTIEMDGGLITSGYQGATLGNSEGDYGQRFFFRGVRIVMRPNGVRYVGAAREGCYGVTVRGGKFYGYGCTITFEGTPDDFYGDDRLKGKDRQAPRFVGISDAYGILAGETPTTRQQIEVIDTTIRFAKAYRQKYPQTTFDLEGAQVDAAKGGRFFVVDGSGSGPLGKFLGTGNVTANRRDLVAVKRAD